MGPLHHVGVVMRNERMMRQFMNLMGLTEEHRGYVAEWHALCVFARAASDASFIECVIADDGPLKAFNKGVGGVHHLAFEVPDLRAAMRGQIAQGVRFLAAEPVRGAGDFICNFIEPAYTGNALIELVEVIPR